MMHQVMNLSRMKGTVTLKLNRKIYPKMIISKAIEDFSELCEFESLNESLVIKAKSKEVPLASIGFEFYNYLLGLINNP